jgi:hypothetical protein
MPRPPSQRRRRRTNSPPPGTWVQRPDSGPQIPTKITTPLGHAATTLGGIATITNSDPWYLAAGLIAAGLISATTWEP